MNTKKNLFLIMAITLGSVLALPAQGFKDGGPPQRGGEQGRPGGGPQGKGDILERFDKDGDGQLSESEREAAEAAMEKEIIDRASQHFDEIDKDGDGVLSREEFIAGVRKQMKDRREQMKDRRERGRELMEKFDKDGDGKLDNKEREALRQHMQSERPMR